MLRVESGALGPVRDQLELPMVGSVHADVADHDGALQARVLGQLAQGLLQRAQDDRAPVRSSSEPSADVPLASTETADEACSNATPRSRPSRNLTSVAMWK
jgi:hypothetical protein